MKKIIFFSGVFAIFAVGQLGAMQDSKKRVNFAENSAIMVKPFDSAESVKMYLPGGSKPLINFGTNENEVVVPVGLRKSEIDGFANRLKSNFQNVVRRCYLNPVNHESLSYEKIAAISIKDRITKGQTLANSDYSNNKPSASGAPAPLGATVWSDSFGSVSCFLRDVPLLVKDLNEVNSRFYIPELAEYNACELAEILLNCDAVGELMQQEKGPEKIAHIIDVMNGSAASTVFANMEKLNRLNNNNQERYTFLKDLRNANGLKSGNSVRQWGDSLESQDLNDLSNKLLMASTVSAAVGIVGLKQLLKK